MSVGESTKSVEWWCMDIRTGYDTKLESEEAARDHVAMCEHCALVKRTVTVVDLVVEKARKAP